MLETIFDLIQDPSNVCNWQALFEMLLGLVFLIAGIVSIVYAPAWWPLGLIVAAVGAAGLIFGHL